MATSEGAICRTLDCVLFDRHSLRHSGRRGISIRFWLRTNGLGQDAPSGIRYGDARAYLQGVVIGTIRIPLSLGRRAAVLDVLRSIQGPVSAQPGCVGCHIYEEEDPEQAVILVERWESEADLEEHIRSEAYRRILNSIELSGRPPEVRFDYVSSSKGLELVERLRDAGNHNLG